MILCHVVYKRKYSKLCGVMSELNDEREIIVMPYMYSRGHSIEKRHLMAIAYSTLNVILMRNFCIYFVKNFPTNKLHQNKSFENQTFFNSS